MHRKETVVVFLKRISNARLFVKFNGKKTRPSAGRPRAASVPKLFFFAKCTCVILDGYWNRQTGRHKELRFLDFILLVLLQGCSKLPR